jgi:succinate dehydrogenase/fumarate reductase flavoprotein subunit
VDRPDYRPELPGAKPAGRSLDNLPYACGHLADIPVRQRFALPVVHEERRLMRRAEGGERVDRALLEQRAKDGIRTLGGALAGALLTACIDRSVTFIPDSRVSELIDRDGRIEGIKVARGAERQLIGARRGVVVASGGFEWNAAMKAAFLGSPECIPVSPPYNDGDGILLGLRAGAAVANMTQAWWVPTYRIPGELDDGCPKARHIADELALPGSIVVNSSGQRFVNEATNYNDLGRAFAQFDIGSYRYENALAWLVFDNAFRSRYIVATLAPDAPAPDWWSRGDSPRQLAEAIGVDADALTATIAGFNDSALRGVDEAFRRGESVHDRYYGDDNVAPNPCLAPLTEPPYFAIEVHSGAFGTKGGLAIDSTGRVLTTDGRVIDGLYAAGNASAAITGPGYPGAGATLASALTFGFLVGRALR